MTKKRWIITIIIIAVIHSLLSFLLTSISLDIIWSRFDGNPYQSSLDPVWVGLFVLFNLPYFLLSYFPVPLAVIPGGYYLTWVVNSLTWGLLGAWILSNFSFMKQKGSLSEINGE